MGEYAYHHGERVKLGTCEDLGYLRVEHVPELTMRDRHDTDVMSALDMFLFRFPWPDEDHLRPGDYDKMNRSVGLHKATVPDGVDHYSVQFKSNYPDHYLVSLPCPEDPSADFKGFRIARNGFSGSVHIVQQRVWGNRLVLVAQCGGCHTRYRLERLEDAQSIIDECRERAAREIHDLEVQNRREIAAGNPPYDQAKNAGAKFWNTIADRIEAGYTFPPAWIALRPPRPNTEESPTKATTYTLHYVSEDSPERGTWSIYAEQYVTQDSDEPIDGTQRLVESGFATEAEADERAKVLQGSANNT